MIKLRELRSVSRLAVLLLLLLLLQVGCAPRYLANQLLKPERGKTTAVPVEKSTWREDPMLDARWVVPIAAQSNQGEKTDSFTDPFTDSGTDSDADSCIELAVYQIEPWSYQIIDSNQRAKSSASSPVSRLPDDSDQVIYRRLTDPKLFKSMKQADYGLIWPQKPWQAVDGVLVHREKVLQQEFVFKKAREPLSLQSMMIAEPMGTVILLQGWQAPLLQVPYLRPMAANLSSMGYRVLMPEVRGQGESGGLMRGMLVQDAQDMSALLTVLIEKEIAQPPIVVVGHSFGATLGLIWAGQDGRIDQVVAIAPMHDLRQAFPTAIRAVVKRTQPWFHTVLFQMAYTKDRLEAACDLAAQQVGIDLNQASTVKAIQQSKASVLILAGSEDWVCLPEWSEQIARARPMDTELIIAEGEDHWSILSDWDRLNPTIEKWLQRFVQK